MSVSLPAFRLEVYLGEWEFAARHQLTASDAQTLTIGELLELGTDEQRGVESFCRDAVREAGVLLLPASIYKSELAPVPSDRFRIGVGRIGAEEALAALDGFLRAR